MKPTRAADHYVPTYFLASLGTGGLSVTFFMYLMFWVPHPGRPVPVFEDILAAFSTGGLPMKTAILAAWIVDPMLFLIHRMTSWIKSFVHQPL